MIKTSVIDRLQTNLQTSGLSNKDNPLFQVIDQLIKYVKIIAEEVNASVDEIDETVVTQNINSIISIDLGDGGSSGGSDDSLVVPGPAGAAGISNVPGPMGQMGAIIFPPDAEDGDIYPPIVGPQGNPGPTGGQGPLGITMMVEDGRDGEDGFSIVGNATEGSDWDIEIIKTSDQTVTDNSTLQSDTELTIALLGTSIYYVEFLIIYSGNNTTGDYKWQFLIDQNLTAASQWFGWSQVLSATLASGNPSGAIGANSAGNALWPAASISTGVDASSNKFAFTGRFTIITTTAPTLTFTFANVAAAAGRESTTRAGSKLRVKKIF